tara:strand:- start:1703 stop:2743 length:1041 start_codon:yes stop_codon:yes gene_type:complete
MDPIRINLYSDTQTQPSADMRNAMAMAKVGDEQQHLDPSVNRLCDEVADLLGKDAAIFLPSGSMCNHIAISVHCEPGDEIIADKTAHIVNNEAAGASVIAGAAIRSVNGKRGIFDLTDVEPLIRRGRPLEPRSRLIVIEQTSNAGGGSVWQCDIVEGISDVAKSHGLFMHMDGARLLNASVASNILPADFARYFDSVWLDLSKGLGCPVGAVLAGSKTFIDRAWRWKHRLGGAMRQAGILAAAGSWALSNNIDRLAVDHRNANRFARSIETIDGVKILNPEVETNIVFFDIKDTCMQASVLTKELRKHGIWIGDNGKFLLRAVTHLDVDESDIDEAAGLIRKILVA